MWFYFKEISWSQIFNISGIEVASNSRVKEYTLDWPTLTKGFSIDNVDFAASFASKLGFFKFAHKIKFYKILNFK